MSQFYTIYDIVEILQISYCKVNGLVKKGIIPSYKIGLQYRIDKLDFEDYLASTKVSTKAKHKVVKRNVLKTPRYDNPWGVPLIK